VACKNLPWYYKKRYRRKHDGKFVKRVKPLPTAEGKSRKRKISRRR
jgi:hypothetical protein